MNPLPGSACFYSGKLRRQPDSSVAVCLCRGMVRTFSFFGWSSFYLLLWEILLSGFVPNLVLVADFWDNLKKGQKRFFSAATISLMWEEWRSIVRRSLLFISTQLNWTQLSSSFGADSMLTTAPQSIQCISKPSPPALQRVWTTKNPRNVQACDIQLDCTSLWIFLP